MLRRPNTSDFKKPKRVRVKRTVRTLLSPEQLNQAMARESARVDRKGASAMAMILFRIPQSQRTTLSAVRLARTILKRIRVTDDVGWFDDEHLGLILPDTPAAGAWRLAQDVCNVVAQKGARPLCTMYTYPADVAREAGRAEPAVPGAMIRTEEPDIAPQAPFPVKVAS